MQNIDLHAHSNYSDGNLAPCEVIRRGHELGIKIMSLVDHNTITSFPQALQEGKRLGMLIIPGVEIAAICYGIKIHMLIYDFEPENRTLSHKLKQMMMSRDCHLERMAEKLQAIGVSFQIDENMKAIKGSRLESYIAGTVLADPKNRTRLQSENINTPYEFKEKYLVAGKTAHADRLKISAKEAIELAHQAGGKIFLAHPQSTLRRSFTRFIRGLIGKLCALGLDGVEVFHSENCEQSTQLLRRLVKDHKLLESAGSDFHGDHPPFPSHLKLGEWKNFNLSPDLAWVHSAKRH